MSKAFDVICMRTVRKALKKYGVDEETIQMVMKLYKVDNNVIRIGSNEEEFRRGRGVRQGDAMSPILFVLGLQYALDKIDWQEMGIDINGSKLRILIYADDITILANNTEELKEMTEKVEEATNMIGLRMNKEKTCWMGNVEGVLRIQNMEIQKTEKCKYLGQTLTFPNEHGEEIKDRIRSGWCKFQEVKWLLMNKKTPTSLW
ncbi:unnamed protein product [Bursaphelenchus okinawaensis]|uniref:Reverse transcriptase domain-containing protein n=1 Tax=Bursaphelenchus okinawaensis TaxID=465554 RepID=A0A811K999_9BILA|nr:unnamed protein product [Bursaphelenchus okinawaensis]CAG9095592.1 unnamed protein product [Bursaphelenchus okinawaensis]